MREGLRALGGGLGGGHMGLAVEAGGHLQGRLVPLKNKGLFIKRAVCAHKRTSGVERKEISSMWPLVGLKPSLAFSAQVQVARRRELGQAAGKRLAWPAALGCTDKQQGSAHRRGCHTHEAVAPPATHPQ